MEPRKFYIGEKVRGNAKASIYAITSPGWVGIVVANLPEGMIKVRSIHSGNAWRVEESRFDSFYPREPLRNEEGKAICDQCGEVIEDESEIVWVKGKAICKECLEKDFEECAICGEFELKDELVEIEGLMLCKACRENNEVVYTCAGCGKMHLCLNGYEYLASGQRICYDCTRSGEFEQCSDCGRWFNAEDISVSRRDGQRRCADCERAFKAKAIKEYGYKPNPIFKMHNHPDFETDLRIKDLLFGVELEIDKGENREDCAGELLEATPDIYCKRDGSLMNGIEIVTHPCTLEYHMEDLGWDKLAEIALKYNFRSQEARTCGLHVHVGRRQMGKTAKERKETAAKIVLLADRHWESLVVFSRRKPEQLERWAARPAVEYSEVEDDEKTLIDAALDTKRDGRYQAINLENSNTVEFRLFNGTLKVSTIIATLQLVSRIVKYAKEKTADECMVSTWRDIVNGNLIDSAEYSELSEYLEARELTVGREPTEYNWKAEKVRYKVGDKVKIVNARGQGIRRLGEYIGETATIIAVYEDAFGPDGTHDYQYAVDFGHEGLGLHNVDGKLPMPTGYKLYGKNLEKYEEE